MSKPSFDHYYLYEELEEFLVQITLSYPNISKLYSIGKTHRREDFLRRRLRKPTGSPSYTPVCFQKLRLWKRKPQILEMESTRYTSRYPTKGSSQPV